MSQPFEDPATRPDRGAEDRERDGSGTAAPDADAAGGAEDGPRGARLRAADEPRDQVPPMPPGFVVEQASVDELLRRLGRLERRLRVQFFALLLVILAGGWTLLDGFLVEDVVVRQKLMESRELTLLDNDGQARLFLRMYSKVPVLQIMDSNGRPRMSLGLRFDDTPFLDLSDARGRTRASLQMTEDDAPALRLFDENGNTTFNIN